MDILLTSLLSVFFAEMGDRPQILCAALAIRFGRNMPVLAGLALATLLNCLLSGVGGSVIDQWISEEPLRLFHGLSYVFAALAMLGKRRAVDTLSNWKIGIFLTSFLGLFILQLGDKSQFILAAKSALTPQWGFAIVGGWIGIMAACVPAIVLRDQLVALPLRAIRYYAGGIMLLWGGYLMLSAWGLLG